MIFQVISVVLGCALVFVAGFLLGFILAVQAGEEVNRAKK